MAENNAQVTLKNKNEEKQSILLELKETSRPFLIILILKIVILRQR